MSFLKFSVRCGSRRGCQYGSAYHVVQKPNFTRNILMTTFTVHRRLQHNRLAVADCALSRKFATRRPQCQWNIDEYMMQYFIPEARSKGQITQCSLEKRHARHCAHCASTSGSVPKFKTDGRNFRSQELSFIGSKTSCNCHSQSETQNQKLGITVLCQKTRPWRQNTHMQTQTEMSSDN